MVSKHQRHICDYCSESKEKLKQDSNDECTIKYEVHLRKVKKQKLLKDEWILKAKNDSPFIVLESDYAQNYAVPKINVNSHFYKRLLQLYAFNIHLYNDDSLFS